MPFGQILPFCPPTARTGKTCSEGQPVMESILPRRLCFPLRRNLTSAPQLNSS